MVHPYRPLFVEADMKTTVELDLEEVHEAVTDWLENHYSVPSSAKMSFSTRSRDGGTEIIGIKIEWSDK